MQTKPNLKQSKTNNNYITSLTGSDSLFELLYGGKSEQTRLAKWKSAQLTVESSFLEKGSRLTPYTPANPLLKHRIILFPSEAADYGREADLIKEIRIFIHKYVDVSKAFETASVYYVLLSWVYDTFNEVPYLRICGDFGSGKTRFLQTVGSICYKPIFASGASTVAPLFHILNQIGGTLVLDEGDFRYSDERADIAKILNNGNARGFPVLRCEKINQNEFSPKAYQVFGPKIVTSRNNYEDLALESRFITEEVGWQKVRGDIPVTLPPTFPDEALALRNKLLMWRFRHFFKKRFPENCRNPRLDSRINQIYSPLLSLVADPDDRAKITGLAQKSQEQIRSDRGLSAEADVLAAIQEGFRQPGGQLSVSTITEIFIRNFSALYENRITPKWIGSIIRKKLRLATRKSNGIYIICENQKDKINNLSQKHNIDD